MARKTARRGFRTLRVVEGKIGRDRYVLRWFGARSYVYFRQYLGALKHSVPKLRDVYLGAIDPELALGGTAAELAAAALRLRRKKAATMRAARATQAGR